MYTIHTIHTVHTIHTIQASRGLVQHDTQSGSFYNVEKNTLVKKGVALKKDDLVLRTVDPKGNESEKEYTWKVVELNYAQEICANKLELGTQYTVYVPNMKQVFPYRLVGKNILTEEFVFQSLDSKVDNITCTNHTLPSVYQQGTAVHGGVESVILESIIRNEEDHSYAKETLDFATMSNGEFTIDVGHSHVCEAIGKPHGSKVHLAAVPTTYFTLFCLKPPL